MVPDAGVSELILPVCDQLGEDDLAAALGRLAARPVGEGDEQGAE